MLCIIFFTDGTKLPYLRPWDITTLKLLDTWKGSGRDKLKQEKTEVHMKLFMIVVLPQSDYEIPGLDNLLSCFVNSFTGLYEWKFFTTATKRWKIYQWCMNEWICFDLKLLPNNNTIYTVKSRREKYNYIFYVLILIYFICKG